MNRGIQEFYYTRTLPARSIEIAQVSTTPASPASLTDINNDLYLPGTLAAQGYPSGTTFTASGIGVSVAITGYTVYTVQNQFFELTDQVDANNNPLYYQHALPIGVTNVTILDLQGNTISSGFVVRSLSRAPTPTTYVLHSFPKVPYQVRYVDAQGFLHLELLKYQNVISLDPFNATLSTYTRSTLNFTVFASVTTYYIRWYANNGYQILPPYGTTPNDPWFARIRFNLMPTPPEWATQVWTPHRPYILATWVPGTVLSNHIVQFERKPIYFKNGVYPDVLVYDKNYVLKYALAGTTGHGFLFPWRLNQFVDIDVNTAELQLAVELDPTDIVFGFYSYYEPDVIYRALDINPYTNPAIRNRVIQFFVKTDGADLLHYLYYNILNSDGSVFQTNDSSPSTGTAHIFGTILIGQATSTGDFTFIDSRTRGGGLAPQYQAIPESANFWDLGFWDGKPFPVGGAMIVYLPVTLQNIFSKDEVQQIVNSVCPMGTIPVIRYYDSNANETV